MRHPGTLATVAVFIAGFLTLGYRLGGPVPATVFAVACGGGTLLWLFVFPFLEDGTFHYVSGMYTAALPLIPAAYGLRVLFRELRTARTAPSATA